jgi:hypothetical protein
MRTLPFLAALLVLPAWAAESPTFPISFTTARAGKVSVNLFDAQGKLVHQLAVGVPADPGTHTLAWDGCDDAGRPVAVGTYTFRGLSADLHSVFDGKLGNSSPAQGDEAYMYRTGQYTDVLALPDGGLLTCSAWGEHARMCQRISGLPDYPVKWSAQVVDYWGPSVNCTFGLACAADDEYLYTVSAKLSPPDPQGCEALSRWRLQDGVRVPFKTGGPGDAFGVILLSQPRGPSDHKWGLSPGRDPLEGLDVVGIACRNGLLFVAHQLENRIDRLDPKTGQVTGVAEVMHPRRLAWDAAGQNLYVTTPHQLLRFGRDAKEGQVLAHDLSLATGVAVGPQGDIYVTDLGASQQLKVFSPQGELLRTFGVRGGHQGGRIAPNLLDNPLGVSVGPDGTVFLADFGGERVLALNPDLTVRKQIYGTMTYGMCLSELDPDLVYRFWPTQDLWEYRVDYRTGQAIQTRRWRFDRCGMAGWPINHGKVQFRRWGGRTFAIWAAHGAVAEIAGDRLIPRLLLGNGPLPTSVVDDRPGTTGVSPVTPSPPSPARERGSGGEAPLPWVWRDQNADGLAEASEFEFGPWNHAWNYHDGQVDAAGNLLIPSRYTDYRDPVIQPAGVLKVPFEGLDEHGIPKYHWKSAQWVIKIPGTGIPLKEMAGVPVEQLVGRDGVKYTPQPATCALDRAGNYLVADSGDIFSEPNRPLDIRKYSPTGELLWQVGQRQWGGQRRPGDIAFAGNFSGDIDHRYFFWVDYDGTMNGWDADGLWLGRLFADLPPELQNLGECFHGAIFRHPNGKVYAYASPDCTYRMSRIVVEGLDQVEHFAGTVTVDRPPAPRAAVSTEQPPWRVLRTRGPVQIDGVIGAAEWGTNTDTQAPEDLYVGEQRGARCWAQWDDRALYLAWNIEDPTPAVNMSRAESRWSGDQVEFMIRAQAGLQGVSGAGQYSPLEYQMAIGPDADGMLGAFVQMNGSDKRGKLLPGVEVALKVRPDKSGYSLEARIPWASLGDWRPQVGDQVKWNMIVDWGSADGTAWDHNAKWVPGVHTNPSNWGVAVFE